MAVVRDYIPEGEELTPTEKAFRQALRARVQQGLVIDYIPAEGVKAAPPSGRDYQFEEALAAALAKAETAAEDDYRDAVNRLRNMRVVEAVQHIATLPSAIQEMYIVAEMLNGNRKSILERFPTPDPEAVEKYTAIDEKIKAKEEE
jgi:hypothetical protein